LIAIAQQLSPAEVKEQLLKQIKQSMTDKSWRVRYMSASHFNEVSIARQNLSLQEHYLQFFNSLPRLWGRIWSRRSLLRTTYSFSRTMKPKFALLRPAKYQVLACCQVYYN
jgi:hypothetical protein